MYINSYNTVAVKGKNLLWLYKCQSSRSLLAQHAITANATQMETNKYFNNFSTVCNLKIMEDNHYLFLSHRAAKLMHGNHSV